MAIPFLQKCLKFDFKISCVGAFVQAVLMQKCNRNKAKSWAYFQALIVTNNDN